MDKLVEIEKKVEQKTQIEEEKTDYLKSFENMTLADVKKRQQEEEDKNFQIEKNQLIQEQFASNEKKEEKEVCQNVVEKPNYDLIQGNKKIIKIKRLQKEQEKPKKKKLTLVLSIVLGICSVIFVGNMIAIDNMSSNLTQLEHEYYDVNLPQYVKNITNLDSAKRSMEFVETYPEELVDAGQITQKTNWFDKFCDFMSGLFGG